jgi:predicted phage terminase large subunit-like protein
MAEKVRLTPEILLSFSDIYLKSNFDEPVSTPDAHLEWWGYCCMDVPWVAIAAPRGHAKSTAITHTFVLANICLRVKRHVLIVSDTEKQAMMFLGNIARELRENENLIRSFGVKRIVKDNESEVILEFHDGELARIAAHGSGQRIRGTNWRGIRPDLVICDDLENDELVMNEDRREKFRDWFFQTLVPLCGRSGEIRVVGTILHEDSFLAGLMPNLIEDKLCVDTGVKVITTADRAWEGALYRAHPDFDDFSQLLWPEQWSETRLRRLMKFYVDRGVPEKYAQELLNRPGGGEGAYFAEEDLINIPLEERIPGERSPEHFYIGVDLAISEKTRRAFTVFAVLGYDAARILRCREIIRKRMGTLEILDTFFHLHRKYKAKAAQQEEPIFLVEKENIAKAIGPVLNKMMEEEDEWLVIELMPPIHDKEMRARPLQSRTRGRRVEWDQEADWWPVLKNELLTFPRSTYDDQVDACAWVGHYVSRMKETPDYEDIEEEAYQEEYSRVMGRSGYGRNPVTGY